MSEPRSSECLLTGGVLGKKPRQDSDCSSARLGRGELPYQKGSPHPHALSPRAHIFQETTPLMVGEPSERGKEIKMRSLYSKIIGGHWGQIEIASVMVNGQFDRV